MDKTYIVTLNNLPEMTPEQIEDFKNKWIQFQNSSNKIFPHYEIESLDESKIDWYKKLLNKLKSIRGERLTIESYMSEVEEKINSFEKINLDDDYKDLPEADGIKCPKCGTYISDSSFVSKTESVFKIEPDPHYAWIEIHECVKCETKFRLRNST